MDILHEMLYEFPVREVVSGFEWVDELPSDYWVRKEYDAAVYQIFDEIERLRDIDVAVRNWRIDFVHRVTLSSMDPGTGSALIDVRHPEVFSIR